MSSQNPKIRIYIGQMMLLQVSSPYKYTLLSGSQKGPPQIHSSWVSPSIFTLWRQGLSSTAAAAVYIDKVVSTNILVAELIECRLEANALNKIHNKELSSTFNLASRRRIFNYSSTNS